MLRYKSLMTRIPLFNDSPDNRFRLFSLSIRLCLFRQYIRYRCQSRFSCTTHLVHYRTLQQPQANRRDSHQHNCRSRHRPTTEHDLFLLSYRHGCGDRQYLLQPFPAGIRQRFGIIIQPLLYLFQPQFIIFHHTSFPSLSIVLHPLPHFCSQSSFGACQLRSR